MLCYEAADKRETPDLMTRFREEHYDTKAHRTWVKVQRAGDTVHKAVTSSADGLTAAEWLTLRSRYFARKAKGHTGPRWKARQARLDGI